MAEETDSDSRKIRMNKAELITQGYWSLSKQWRGRMEGSLTVESAISGLNNIWLSAANAGAHKLSDLCHTMMDGIIMNKKPKKAKQAATNVVPFMRPKTSRAASEATVEVVPSFRTGN